MSGFIPVGRINFSNVLPVFNSIDHIAETHGFKFITEVPTALNRMLHEGKIVSGPISAFSYAEHAAEYYAFSGLSVSSRGPVGSIFLFSKRPIDDLDGRDVALTSASATSVNLLKILFQQYYSVKPNYITRPPHLVQMMEEADAALLIGDDALYWSLQQHPYHVYDLGAEWNRRTGLPMTFALWAVRRDFVHDQPVQASKLHQLFLHGKRTGLADIDEVVRSAVRHHGQDEGFWKNYFAKLIHDFKGDLVVGAETYFRAAFAQGLLSRPVKVEMWGDDE